MAAAVPYLIAVGKAILTAAVNAAIAYGVTEILGLNDVPSPEAGKTPIKQSIPPAQHAYGRCRVSGPQALFATVGSRTLDVILLSEGPVQAIDQFWLNDDPVTLTSSNIVNRGSDGRYRREGAENDTIRILHRLGATPSPAYGEVVTYAGGLWTNDHRCDGVASMAIITRGVKAELTQKIYPNGPVQGSAVGNWKRVYDFRKDGSQGGFGMHRLSDPDSWEWSDNPVVCYVHDEVIVNGEDFAYRFAPTLASWTKAANVCDQLVPLKAGGFVKRYTLGGFYADNNQRKDVRARFMSTFDGYVIERGDGAFVCIAGVYEEPTLILNEDRIKQFTWKRTRRREDRVDQVVISYCDPSNKWTMVETEPWRNPDALFPEDYPYPLELAWVNNNSQARRLGKIAYHRLNPEYEGELVVELSESEEELEHRFARLQHAAGPASMQNVAVEITGMTIDLANRLVRYQVIKTYPLAWSWDAALEESNPPPITPGQPRPGTPAPVIDSFVLLADGGTPRLQIVLEDPGRTDYAVVLRLREGSGAIVQQLLDPIPYSVSGFVVVTSGSLPVDQDLEFSLAYQNGGGGTGDSTDFVSVLSALPGARRPTGRSIQFPTEDDGTGSGINIFAHDVYFGDGTTVSIPAGEVTGLSPSKQYGVFWRSDLGFQAEESPAPVFMTTGRRIFLGWQTTSNGSGGFPPPDAPPPGWGGDGTVDQQFQVAP